MLEEVDDPEPAAGQVVIDVHACAVNFPDVLMIQDMYQFKPPLPSPGRRSGRRPCSALGRGVDGVAVGDRVIQVAGWGGVSPEGRPRVAASMIPVPDDIDLVHASSFLYAYGTSQYALKDRGHLQPGGDAVALGAAGGVGLAAVELGAVMGANVIAAASTDDKLELCREYGASMTINYATEDLKTRIRELTGGAGADVVYDAVGGAYSEPALRSMAWEGRFLVIGFAAGEIPKVPLNLALLKSCDIVGVFWGAFVGRERDRHRQNIAELMELVARRQAPPARVVDVPARARRRAIRELADRRVMERSSSPSFDPLVAPRCRYLSRR